MPFPTSGNAADDQLASLLASFEPTVARWVWENLSLDRIDRVSYCLNQLSIPEGDRIATFVAQIALQKNPNLFSMDEAEKAFAEVDNYINTGKLENGWKSSRD
ncbi:MAG: hypothetical protein ACFB2W_00495 [Leptolyngbyaceae cyanobacterium]